MTSLSDYSFAAVARNETNNNHAVADKLSNPVDGNSGWTVGYIQFDFKTNSTQAKQVLTQALTDSGRFTAAQAATVAQDVSNAGSSQSINFSNVTDASGHSVNLQSVNNALVTSAADTDIYNSSASAFRTDFLNLKSNVFSNPSLTSSVASAMNDPIESPVLKTVLADYDNQYHISGGGNMMQLLTTGSATFGGRTVTIDGTNPNTVTQSVMSAVLDTQWASKSSGFEARACNRLASDVASASQYDQITGGNTIYPTGSLTVTANNGSCTITQGASSGNWTGSWTDTSPISSNSYGSGAAAATGTAVNASDTTTTNYAAGGSTNQSFASTGVQEYNDHVYSGSNDTGSLNEVAVVVPDTMPGQVDSLSIDSAHLYVGGLTSFSLTGSQDYIDGLGDDTFNIWGTADRVNTYGSQVNFDGASNSGDVVYGAGDSGAAWSSWGGVGAYGGYGDSTTYGYGGYEGYAGYGLASNSGRGEDIGAIAKRYQASGDAAAELRAVAARMQASDAQDAISAGAAPSASFEGPSWKNPTVTWSFSDLTSSGNLSAAQASEYNAAIEQALSEWSRVTGIDFVEKKSGVAQIQLGFDDFGSATTGVLGYTKLQAVFGVAIQSEVSLEDPNETALVADVSGNTSYAGTGTELNQLVLHEIGHALGFGDSTDPLSVMAPTLGEKNRELDGTDVSAANDLYNQSAPVNVEESISGNSMKPYMNDAERLIDAASTFSNSPSTDSLSYISTPVAGNEFAALLRPAA